MYYICYSKTMPTSISPISLRIPETVAHRLNVLAKETKRTRSSLMVEAIEVYLNDYTNQQAPDDLQGRFDDILKFKGAGAAVAKPRSAREIQASIEDLRGDE